MKLPRWLAGYADAPQFGFVRDGFSVEMWVGRFTLSCGLARQVGAGIVLRADSIDIDLPFVYLALSWWGTDWGSDEWHDGGEYRVDYDDAFDLDLKYPDVLTTPTHVAEAQGGAKRAKKKAKPKKRGRKSKK